MINEIFNHWLNASLFFRVLAKVKLSPARIAAGKDDVEIKPNRAGGNASNVVN
jgi:hypothetical protein